VTSGIGRVAPLISLLRRVAESEGLAPGVHPDLAQRQGV
jgi:hypothetical protein